MHSSIRLEMPIEFIDIKPETPLISKCQIKVCYVGEKPNRNGSIITKEVAREMANSLPGSPIVGYYNENSQDFEEHNRMIDISNGKFEIKDTTRPYGFVDLSAKVWFQKFLDDGQTEHEYLMTEGWLWTGQYPECKRVITKGNNQSMELSEDFLNASWSESKNGEPQFFIINEAIISKLCILGEDCEPCFEGAIITEPKIQFSYSDNFKKELDTMAGYLQRFLQKGGAKVFSRYAVAIGDNTWNNVYNYVENELASAYRIDSFCEEEGQKFAVLQHNSDEKFYRLNFSVTGTEEFDISSTLVEITSSYSANNEPQFNADDVAAYAENKKKKSEEDEDKSGKENTDDSEDKSESSTDTEDDDKDKKKKKDNKDFSEKQDEEKCPECGKPLTECTCKEKKDKYNLEEIVEYVELKAQYSELATKYDRLLNEKSSLEEQLSGLKEFKQATERKDKEAMVESFYMLSDEDKADVVQNIDTYSLDDIEAKLSVICVRNKVNFDLDENKNQKNGSTVFSLEDGEDDATPAWVKRALAVAQSLD